VDDVAFGGLLQLLHYIDGDYESPATFYALRTQLGEAQRARIISLFHQPVCPW